MDNCGNDIPISSSKAAAYSIRKIDRQVVVLFGKFRNTLQSLFKCGILCILASAAVIILTIDPGNIEVTWLDLSDNRRSKMSITGHIVSVMVWEFPFDLSCETCPHDVTAVHLVTNDATLHGKKIPFFIVQRCNQGYASFWGSSRSALPFSRASLRELVSRSFAPIPSAERM